MTLAETMGVSAPTVPAGSGHRPQLESKLGIQPPLTRPHGGLGAMGRSSSYGNPHHYRSVSAAQGGSSRSEAESSRLNPPAATKGEDRPRTADSQGRTSRQGSEEAPPARKTHGISSIINAARRGRSSEERRDNKSVLKDKDYNGKSSSGSDKSGPDAGAKGSSSPIGRELPDELACSTPALPTGARSLRSSQTATVGRSGARTLKRYGAGEARPNHVRPARVMLTQGADESDGEDEGDPGVGVGSGTTVAVTPAVERKETGISQANSLDDSWQRRNAAKEGRPSPPIQSSSKYLEGLSLQKTKGNDSPRSPVDVEARAAPIAENHERNRSEMPTSPPGGSVEARPNSRPSSRREKLKALPTEDLPDMQIGADDEDDVDAEEDALAKQKRVGQGTHAQAKRYESTARRPMTDASPADKENAVPAASSNGNAARQAMGEVLKAKVPLPSAPQVNGMRRGQTLQERPLQERGPQAAHQQSQPRHAPAAVPSKPLAATPAPANASPPAPEAALTASNPRLAAEKQRLLDLNGWDPYVRAALDEAERQRRNGCRFGEQMVGRAMSSRKETKFRGAKYLKVSKAGEGGFSTVFQVLGPVTIPTLDGGSEPVPEELQAYFAMKQVSLKRLEQSSRDELLQEAELLENLAVVEGSDKYVLRYFGHKHSGDTLKILMELGEMDFNTLLRTQHPLPRAALSEYWRQMLESVHFVHNAKLVHTDLKPANFLLVKGRIKLIDFGIAQKIPLGTMHISRDVIVGTPNYMAPEAIQKARRGGQGVYKAGKPSDVWSMGCILYQMVYGRTPFAHISGDRKLEVITDSRHQIAFPIRRTLDERVANEADDPNGDGGDSVEELDEILIDCLKASLLYDAQSRATIPSLMDHLFVRDDVTLSRSKLKSIVQRIQTYMMQGGLTEDNVEEMAERLMTNLQLDAFEPFVGAVLQ